MTDFYVTFGQAWLSSRGYVCLTATEEFQVIIPDQFVLRKKSKKV